MDDWSCDGWAATQDGSQLTVTGTCHAPRTGFDFKLHVGSANADEGEFVVELEVRRSGYGNPILVDEPVELVASTDRQWKSVSIEPGGPRGIPVRQSG